MQDSPTSRRLIFSGAVFAMLAILVGAFAAHGLSQVLDAYALGLVETASRYQMYHALAMLLVGIIMWNSSVSTRRLVLVAALFGAGILLFSGSLYLLALTGQRWWGAVTPFGGIAFVLGWITLAFAVMKK